MQQQLPSYYNDFSPDKHYDEVLFRADRWAQSREVNFLQSGLIDRITSIANALYKDGDINRDARCIVNSTTGHTQCEAGVIYLKGKMRGIAPASFVIPVVGTINIGVYLVEQIVTEIEDPTLYNPAVGTRGYGEPGAARLQVESAWGFMGDGQPGEFFPVYVVDDGILRAKEAPPNLDGVTQAIARYDRDSAGGSYVVEGLSVSKAPDLADGTQVYLLAEGRARVNGYAITLASGRRLNYPALADVRDVANEPHTSTTIAAQRINLDNTPAKNITSVSITAERSVSVTHGAFSGVTDALPDTSILELVEVKQGATTYTKTTDYKLTAGKVDWSPNGAEPATGSSYTVKYRYIKTVVPTAVDSKGFTVEGAVVGSLVLVDYQHMLPRIDGLCLNADNQVVWLKGVASATNPKAPSVPSSLLLLASIVQTWDSSRYVSEDGVRVVTMPELKAIKQQQDSFRMDLATLRLSVDAKGRSSGIAIGLLADPFIDDSMRDQGIAQSALITSGYLHLPVTTVIHQIGQSLHTPGAASFTLVPVISQTARTGTMLVNPYQAFNPLSSPVVLTPSVDRWTVTDTTPWGGEYQNVYVSPFAINFFNFGGGDFELSNKFESQTVSTEAIEYLRQIPVGFTISNFGPGEAVSKILFDGIDVTPGGVTANAAGVATGSFVIPAGVRAGTKTVHIEGSGGSWGEQFFVGEGSLQHTKQVMVRTFVSWGAVGGAYQSSPPVNSPCLGPSTDPLAQTFTMTRTCQLGGIDLWFTAKSTEVIVQIRETDVGLPNRKVLKEVRLPASQINVDGQPTRVTWAPFEATGGTEYTVVVLCDDAVTSLAVAELGKWDQTNGRWVTAQPYQVGVLLSSSNANTWTPHQDKDLSFRLLAATYTQSSRVIDLGSTAVTGATGLMILAYAEQPSAAAGCYFEITLPDGSSQNVVDAQALNLATPITGNVQVKAHLTAEAAASAVLYPDIQLIEARLGASGTYVSRAIASGANSTLKIIVDADLPSGAAATFEYQGDGKSTWTAIPLQSSTLNSAGIREYIHQVTGVNESAVRVRATISGTSAARPMLSDLRAVVL